MDGSSGDRMCIEIKQSITSTWTGLFSNTRPRTWKGGEGGQCAADRRAAASAVGGGGGGGGRGASTDNEPGLRT